MVVLLDVVSCVVLLDGPSSPSARRPAFVLQMIRTMIPPPAEDPPPPFFNEERFTNPPKHRSQSDLNERYEPQNPPAERASSFCEIAAISSSISPPRSCSPKPGCGRFGAAFRGAGFPQGFAACTAAVLRIPWRRDTFAMNPNSKSISAGYFMRDWWVCGSSIFPLIFISFESRGLAWEWVRCAPAFQGMPPAAPQC